MATYQITDTLNDGAQSAVDTWTSANQDATYGNMVGLLSGVQYAGGYRFPGIAAGQAQIVNSATLRIYVTRTYKEPIMDYYAVAADNAAQFSNGNLPSAAPLTTNFGTHDFTGEGNPTDYLNQNRYIEMDVTAAVQEVLNRAGWVSGNAIAFVALDSLGITSWMYADDVSRVGYNPTELVLDLSAAPAIASGPAQVAADDTGLIYTGLNLDTVTAVYLVCRGVIQALTITAQSAGSITLDIVQGNVPYGVTDAELRFTYATGYTAYSVEFKPAAGNDYVLANIDNGIDPNSMYQGAVPAVQNNDQFEWQEAYLAGANPNGWSGYADGSAVREGGTDITFVYRLWLAGDQQWTPWATITIDGNYVPEAYVFSVLLGLVVQSPQVTATVATAVIQHTILKLLAEAPAVSTVPVARPNSVKLGLLAQAPTISVGPYPLTSRVMFSANSLIR